MASSLKRSFDIIKKGTRGCKKVKLINCDGVQYIRRTLWQHSVRYFVKLRNGSYCVSVDNYLMGRTVYCNRKVIKVVYKLLGKKKQV